MNIKELDSKYIAATYARFPVEIVKGEGSLVFDENGKSYIDLGSGIAANIFGYDDKQWVEAVTKQLSKVQHTSNLYYSIPGAELAQMLCEKTGMKKVFFANSGAEANECAIKAARRWAFQKYGDESHSTIITLKNSFHGRTITTLSATGQDKYHTEFGPFTPGFVYADASDAGSVGRLAEENGCCAVMMEMVQGEGGVVPLDREFVSGALKAAEKYELLVIVDEIQTGNGRTGKLYSWQNFGFTPDIMTTAKGLGGGLPIGACIFGERTENVMTPGSHGSTFGGNPVCCAGAVSILKRIDDSLMAGVMEKSRYITETLTGAPGVLSIAGMGLMLGIETERPAAEIVNGCIERGVLVLTAKNKIRLLPPLNIPIELLKQGITILKEEIAK